MFQNKKHTIAASFPHEAAIAFLKPLERIQNREGRRQMEVFRDFLTIAEIALDRLPEKQLAQIPPPYGPLYEQAAATQTETDRQVVVEQFAQSRNVLHWEAVRTQQLPLFDTDLG